MYSLILLTAKCTSKLHLLLQKFGWHCMYTQYLSISKPICSYHNLLASMQVPGSINASPWWQTSGDLSGMLTFLFTYDKRQEADGLKVSGIQSTVHQGYWTHLPVVAEKNSSYKVIPFFHRASFIASSMLSIIIFIISIHKIDIYL